MADNDNPWADVYNAAALPYMIGPNKYSQFNNKPMAIPGYAGMPTDAMGNPIQPPPGMTLNQSAPAPAAPAATPALNSTQQWWNQLSQPSAMNPSGNAAVGMNEWSAFMGPQGAIDRASPSFLQPGMQGYTGTGTATATQQPAAAAPIDSRQQALTLLANPGKVTTPGANPSAAAPMPNVLDSFLANNRGPTAPGAGGYSNQPFFQTLRGLRGAA